MYVCAFGPCEKTSRASVERPRLYKSVPLLCHPKLGHLPRAAQVLQLRSKGLDETELAAIAAMSDVGFVDHDLIAELILHIDRQGRDGAILCFLPGEKFVCVNDRADEACVCVVERERECVCARERERERERFLERYASMGRAEKDKRGGLQARRVASEAGCKRGGLQARRVASEAGCMLNTACVMEK
jgi:hypothetical protein